MKKTYTMDSSRNNIFTEELEKCATLLWGSHDRKLLAYGFYAYQSEMLMKKIGNLREEVYKKIGSESGKGFDIDHFDFDPNNPKSKSYFQIVIVNKENHQIVAGTRVYWRSASPSQLMLSSSKDFATSTFFHFDNRTIKERLPYTIDIGRMFVQPNINQSKSENSLAKSSLDAIYRSIGKIILTHPHIKHLMGRIIINHSVPKHTRLIIASFFEYFHTDHDLAWSKRPSYKKEALPPLPQDVLNKKGYENIKLAFFKWCRDNGHELPTLVKVYLRFAKQIEYFGGALDSELNNTEEFAIMVSLKNLYPSTRKRYLS